MAFRWIGILGGWGLRGSYGGLGFHFSLAGPLLQQILQQSLAITALMGGLSALASLEVPLISHLIAANVSEFAATFGCLYKDRSRGPV